MNQQKGNDDPPLQVQARILNSLAPISIRLRENGSWYVSFGAEVKEGSILSSPTQSADHPLGAVADCFTQYARGQRVVLNAMDSNKRREMRFNGYMWEDAT